MHQTDPLAVVANRIVENLVFSQTAQIAADQPALDVQPLRKNSSLNATSVSRRHQVSPRRILKLTALGASCYLPFQKLASNVIQWDHMLCRNAQSSRKHPRGLARFPVFQSYNIASRGTAHAMRELTSAKRFVSKRVKLPAYSFSFLTGALYLPESLAIAEVAKNEPNWNVVLERAAQDNLLKQRKLASRTRLLREIKYRLQELNSEELAFLCEAGPRDQRNLLFIALCRRFRFVREFVEEVIRPKATALDVQVYPADFARFFDQKGADAPELDQLTEKSAAKIKQVLIRMLAEAGLMDSTSSQRLVRPSPSKALTKLLAKREPANLRWLLFTDADIRQLTK